MLEGPIPFLLPPSEILNPSLLEPDIMNHTALRQFYVHETYWGVDKQGKAVKKPFIDAWLADHAKRQVLHMVVDPENKSPGCYNLWIPYAATTLKPVSHEEVQALVAPIVKHISDVITGGNDAHTDWILDYLANIVQRPHLKTQVAIILYGSQGCGKDIVFEWFRKKVLGLKCTFQTADPENDIFGRFGVGLVNKVLVLIDEAKALQTFNEKLKNIITSEDIRLEKKCKDILVLKNISNLIFTTNNINPVKIDPDDRRLVTFKCKSVRAGDKAYFNGLGMHMYKDATARAFFQFLLLRDLSNYPFDFQGDRPLTEHYMDSKTLSLPIVPRFLSGLVNSGFANAGLTNPAPLKNLFASCTGMCAKGRYNFGMSDKTFSSQLKNYSESGVKKGRNEHGTTYTFQLEELKAELIFKNHYDPDIFLSCS